MPLILNNGFTEGGHVYLSSLVHVHWNSKYSHWQGSDYHMFKFIKIKEFLRVSNWTHLNLDID